MSNLSKVTTLAALAGLGLSAGAQAAEIPVMNDIAVSTTWIATNTYNLQNQIFVLPGATLTIEAGTVIASDVTANGGGALAVTRGAKIVAVGSKDAPIIFTSKDDVATWTLDGSHPTGGDPTTGVWREACNEWGNLTIMGRGHISENATPGNVPTCNANNVGAMEGLLESFPGDPNVRYGGGDDDDDSGSLSHVSLRYGGRVIGLANELNGLSLGGIGQETDIDHVEIMNNVDDGVEIWGGCVNIKNISIWNIGDDSLDIDQGYRGKIQFALIVQGYSCDDSQGSGVGDNCVETDGAEDSDWQPVTTTVIYNATIIGQPVDGDRGTAWRDNARVQYRNCIFMDIGEHVVGFDNVDGDGANGYGFNGTLSWADTWTTDWNAVPAHANDCPPGTYKAQSSGKLAEIKDSVFFRNLHASAYVEATARGVFDAGNDNLLVPGFDDADMPIQTLTRGAPVVKGGKTMVPVTFLDPRPKNEALESVDFCFGDDFICPVKYRGAFAPEMNWLAGWTASEAYGFTPGSNWCDVGCAKAGAFCGFPLHSATGALSSLSINQATLQKTQPFSLAGLFIAPLTSTPVPFKKGTLCAFPFIGAPTVLTTNANGQIILPFQWPAGIPAGLPIYLQWAVQDNTATVNTALSNAVRGITQ